MIKPHFFKRLTANSFLLFSLCLHFSSQAAVVKQQADFGVNIKFTGYVKFKERVTCDIRLVDENGYFSTMSNSTGYSTNVVKPSLGSLTWRNLADRAISSSMPAQFNSIARGYYNTRSGYTDATILNSLNNIYGGTNGWALRKFDLICPNNASDQTVIMSIDSTNMRFNGTTGDLGVWKNVNPGQESYTGNYQYLDNYLELYTLVNSNYLVNKTGQNLMWLDQSTITSNLSKYQVSLSANQSVSLSTFFFLINNRTGVSAPSETLKYYTYLTLKFEYQ